MDHSLPRWKRLTRKSEFDHVFAHGQRLSHQGMTAVLSPSPHPRLGCAVPGRVGSHARRNAWKRRVRAVFRQSYDQLPAADIVVSTSLGGGSASYHDIEDLFRQLCSRSAPDPS